MSQEQPLSAPRQNAAALQQPRNAAGLPDAASVLQFWFEQTSPKLWFQGGADFDALVAQRFGALLQAAAQGELYGWRSTAPGRLAEVLVLDQFPRNIHRGTAQAFATDAMALVLAQEAVAGGHDQALPLPQRAFLYLPYMHSESRLIHQQAERLFATPGLEDNYRFQLAHQAIIERFGRYPHRNRALGRQSTPAELEFLQQPGSSF